jgi:hypothetical protein
MGVALFHAYHRCSAKIVGDQEWHALQLKAYLQSAKVDEWSHKIENTIVCADCSYYT